VFHVGLLFGVHKYYLIYFEWKDLWFIGGVIPATYAIPKSAKYIGTYPSNFHLHTLSAVQLYLKKIVIFSKAVIHAKQCKI